MVRQGSCLDRVGITVLTCRCAVTARRLAADRVLCEGGQGIGLSWLCETDT